MSVYEATGQPWERQDDNEDGRRDGDKREWEEGSVVSLSARLVMNEAGSEMIDCIERLNYLELIKAAAAVLNLLSIDRSTQISCIHEILNRLKITVFQNHNATKHTTNLRVV